MILSKTNYSVGIELGYDEYSIRVDVESVPTWKTKPKDLHLGEGDSAEFVCESDSHTRPATNTRWFINGVPFQDPSVPRSPRRKFFRNRMIIQNVTKQDIAVYQCNISNRHGHLFANFFLNVNCEYYS